MRVRVGIDLVDVDEVRRSLDSHGERYVARVFTEEEAAGARTEGPGLATRLASCFAAKEAVAKALGRDVPPRSVELVGGSRDAGLRLTGAAAEEATRAGLDEWSVTFARASGYACAVVIARGAS